MQIYALARAHRSNDRLRRLKTQMRKYIPRHCVISWKSNKSRALTHKWVNKYIDRCIGESCQSSSIRKQFRFFRVCKTVYRTLVLHFELVRKIICSSCTHARIYIHIDVIYIFIKPFPRRFEGIVLASRSCTIIIRSSPMKPHCERERSGSVKLTCGRYK